jgi:hypothetical protein
MKESTTVQSMEASNSSRISLSLSDLVTPAIRDNDLESEARTSVVSVNEAVSYKKELKKLLSKSRGTAYEATLRKFVEAKYSEIKQDQENHKRLFSGPKGLGIVSLASLSKSKYDPPPPSPTSTKRNNYAQYSQMDDQQGPEVNEGDDHRFSNHSYSPQRSSRPHSAGYNSGQRVRSSPNGRENNFSTSGFSILNSQQYAHLHGPSSYSDSGAASASRIDEMAKPMARHMYQVCLPICCVRVSDS